MKKISELLVLTFTPSLLMRLVLVCGIVTFMFGGCVAIPTIEALGPLPPPQPIGTFTDSRDGQTYRTVVISGETWMAENLNFETSNSWCYRNDASNCDAYGRLYTWDAAMSACPAGWRLPNDSDWRTLTNAISNAVGINAGTKLKSTSGWKSRGNGNDEIGFSALPGGYRNTDGSFGFVGHYGRWWSATEHDASRARYQYMLYSNSNVRSGWYGKSLGFSVRCLMDERP